VLTGRNRMNLDLANSFGRSAHLHSSNKGVRE